MCKRFWLSAAVSIGVVAGAAGGSAGATAPAPATQLAAPAPSREVVRLIAKLGARDYHERDAAVERLAEIGGPAIPALREAAGGRDGLARQAAQTALAAIGRRAAAERDTLVPRARVALRDARDYALAAELFERLTLAPDATADDWQGLGDARAGLEQWQPAVDAYRRALGLINLRLAADPATEPMPQPPGDDRLPGRAERGPVVTPEMVRERLAREKAELRPKRLRVLLAIGRIQRDHLDDPAGAALTLASGLNDAPELTGRPIRALEDAYVLVLREKTHDPLHGPMDSVEKARYGELLLAREELLDELSAAHERGGHVAEAIEDLSRASLARAIVGGNATMIDVGPLCRLVRKLPAGAPVPEVPFLHVLTPDAPTFTVDIGTPESQAAAAFWQYTIYGMRAYRFFVCAPAGMELDAVEVSADMERTAELKMGYGIRLVGVNNAHLDSGDVPKGRKVLGKTFKVPPHLTEAPLHVEVMGTTAEGFVIHQVKVKGVLKRQEDEK